MPALRGRCAVTACGSGRRLGAMGISGRRLFAMPFGRLGLCFTMRGGLAHPEERRKDAAEPKAGTDQHQHNRYRQDQQLLLAAFASPFRNIPGGRCGRRCGCHAKLLQTLREPHDAFRRVSAWWAEVLKKV